MHVCQSEQLHDAADGGGLHLPPIFVVSLGMDSRLLTRRASSCVTDKSALSAHARRMARQGWRGKGQPRPLTRALSVTNAVHTVRLLSMTDGRGQSMRHARACEDKGPPWSILPVREAACWGATALRVHQPRLHWLDVGPPFVHLECQVGRPSPCLCCTRRRRRAAQHRLC